MKERESILLILKEQSTFGFTGKINVMLKENDQHIGVIGQNGGDIVFAEYKGVYGKKALFALVFKDIGEADFKYLIEPEIIPESAIDFQYFYEDFYNKVQMRFKDYLNYRKYKPSDNLYLSVASNFFKKVEGEWITPEEFDVLCAIIDYPKVGDLYQKAFLYDYQITKSLVNLRKKGVLKVRQG